MQSVNDIRSHFLGYFEKNGHVQVPSGPLVPRNDPTLMFTNAGMVQFKDYFTGRSVPSFPRAATSQKCVRAGGKHNDLDNVGYTARHLTFFEMLGNFSFGDYFKERAIELAWTLVTKELGLPKDRLLVTVYATDDHAFDLWKKIAGFPDHKIIRIGTSANFWQMGDTGPCGPCSEIFIDQGETVEGGPPGSPDEDGDRFLEFWNLVFMQYEQLPGGERIDLPRPSIDTGMGLERIAAILQNVHSVFDIDLFRTLIEASAEVTGVPESGPQAASHRVIADHLRAASFLIADGVLPSNEGRGYVLRRIMRRAMRHAHLLGAADPVMYRLVPTLVAEMGRAYPELVRAEALIRETLLLEETRFRRTLARGLTLLDEATTSLGAGATLAGDVAFRLYDTFGFPLDLTEDALKARGIRVDTDGFARAMERQKEEARASWAGSGEAQTDPVWFKLRERLGATEFLGYGTEAAEAQVLALVRGIGEAVETAGAGDEVALVVNQTPFYAESGGQVADSGVIVSDSGARFVVTDVQKKADGLFVHYGKVEAGKLAVGDAVRLSVDVLRRRQIRANHSATHLLHAALRNVLGSHVAQKGSLVAPDRLRFDFSHPKPLDAAEIESVESLANEVVLEDAPVVTRLMDRDAAMSSGAMALFGEKYGDEVRVVSMGTTPEGTPGRSWSVELCGGTHVSRTGEIGLVTLLGESAVAAGVRRIEALTGTAARKHLADQERRLKAVAMALKVRPEDAAERVQTLVDDRRRLERELADARRRLAMGGGGGNGADRDIRDIGSVKFLGRSVSGIAPKDLKGLADDGKKAVGSGVVAIVGVGDDGKAGIVVGVTDDLTARFNAVDLVRRGAEALGGKGGGGRPDMAQAGGPEGARAGDAIAAIAAAIELQQLTPGAQAEASLRRRVFDVIEGNSPHSLLPEIFAGGLIVLILINVVAAVFETVPSVSGPNRGLFNFIENFSLLAFGIEYVVRLWISVEYPRYAGMPAWRARLRYVVTPGAIIDFLAIAPFFLGLFTDLNLRTIILLRLLRLFKLERYSTGFQSLFEAVRRERQALLASFLVLFSVVLIAASLAYLAERSVQPEAFGSIPAAVWWAIETVTTVGYGDVVPKTVAGRIVGGLTMITGILMIALPIAIIGSSFAEVVRQRSFVVTYGLVARMPIFAGLSADVLSDLLPLFRAMTVEAGTTIVAARDADDSFFIIAAGVVELEDPTGPRRLGAGEGVGTGANLTAPETKTPAIAVTKVRLLVIARMDLIDLVTRHPVLAERLRPGLGTAESAAAG